MNTVEYLNEAMKATESKTDYQLAKNLEISKARISDYRNGKQRPDEYACMRIATALNLDPAIVIADIAIEWEKNPKKREWWASFLASATKQTVIIMAMVALIYTTISPNVSEAGINKEKNKKTYYISKYYTNLRRWLNTLLNYVGVSCARLSASVTKHSHFSRA